MTGVCGRATAFAIVRAAAVATARGREVALAVLGNSSNYVHSRIFWSIAGWSVGSSVAWRTYCTTLGSGGVKAITCIGATASCIVWTTCGSRATIGIRVIGVGTILAFVDVVVVETWNASDGQTCGGIGVSR